MPLKPRAMHAHTGGAALAHSLREGWRAGAPPPPPHEWCVAAPSRDGARRGAGETTFAQLLATPGAGAHEGAAGLLGARRSTAADARVEEGDVSTNPIGCWVGHLRVHEAKGQNLWVLGNLKRE
eukprot:4311367-Prymnesium_polylepis.1